MEKAVTLVLYSSLAIHVLLVAVAAYRTLNGQNIVDRLMGFDLLTTLILAIIVLLALINRQHIYLAVALGFAALGFVGTFALAKYIADRDVF
jgi:multisubunit Na+/H+ antiporter MnhF subunit